MCMLAIGQSVDYLTGLPDIGRCGPSESYLADCLRPASESGERSRAAKFSQVGRQASSLLACAEDAKGCEPPSGGGVSKRLMFWRQLRR
jgi:hypothetical protein